MANKYIYILERIFLGQQRYVGAGKVLNYLPGTNEGAMTKVKVIVNNYYMHKHIRGI